MNDEERAVLAVLRGERGCRAARLGRVSFSHLWKHDPVRGLVNIVWVKDLRPWQFAQFGYKRDYFERAAKVLAIDRGRFRRANAFVAPTAAFAGRVQRWYGLRLPFFQFANYPDPITFPRGSKRRKEVVYIDNASSLYEEALFSALGGFMLALYDQCGYEGVVVSAHFAEQVQETLARVPHVRAIHARDYDYLSEAGLLVNLTGFQGAVDSLPRKLLTYLHAGMKPLIHGSFSEAVQFCRARGVVPYTYYGPKDVAEAIQARPNFSLDRTYYCIEERIKDLMGFLSQWS